MTAGDRYRVKALEFLAQAKVESSADLRAQFENLAAAYLRLAEQVERNNQLEVEPPEEQGDPTPTPSARR